MATLGLSNGESWSPQQYTKKDMIFFFPVDGMDQVLSLTATTDVAYSAPVQVTQTPVMAGQTLADHIQKQPRTMTINGVVTVQYQSAFGALLQKDNGSVENFVATTSLFRDQKRLLRCISSQGLSLENCFITNFEARRDVSISNGLRINMTFQEVIFIEQLQKVELEGDETGNTRSKGKSGAKTTKDKGVVPKKESGATTTEFTNNQNICKGVARKGEEVGYSGLETAEKRQLSNCLADTTYTKKERGVIYSDADTGAKHSSMFQNMAGNPHKNAPKK